MTMVVMYVDNHMLTMTVRCRYKAMVECQKKGKTKAVGVSNFSRAEMERLLKEVKTVRKKSMPAG